MTRCHAVHIQTATRCNLHYEGDKITGAEAADRVKTKRRRNESGDQER
ncbi:hypothetical protein QCI77_14630 [Bacillus cereus group sp. MG9]